MRKFTVQKGMPLSIWESKYARKTEDGFQTWCERVEEVVQGNFLLDPRARADYEDELKATTELSQAGVLPFSGRHLQHGDLSQADKILENFVNCATALFSFTQFWLLLKGAGVGRCYDSDICRVNWDSMPNTRFVLDEKHPNWAPGIESLSEALHKYDSESEDVRWFSVADSGEGWVKVVEILETAASQGKHADKLFIFDFSKVRPKGTPIKGQQGRPASGPVPFMQALQKVSTIKGAGMRPWKQALFIDHYLSSCVAVGGVRRSARIAVKNWRDKDVIEFIDIKRVESDLAKLYTANNSVGVDAEFWKQALCPRPSHARRVYEAAVGAAYFDRTGEPGFLNIDRLTNNETGMDRITVGNYISQKMQDTLELHPKTMELIGHTLKWVKRKKYKFIVNPCGEITMALQGAYCVIGDICLANVEHLQEAIDGSRLMSPFLVRVNLMPSLYKSEVDRTNRIGVGITGIHEFAWTHFGLAFRDMLDETKSFEFWSFIAQMRRAAETSAADYSEEIGVAIPHTVTTIKPSGCRPWYALTATDKGLLTLEELFEEHPVGEDWHDVTRKISVIQEDTTNQIVKTFHNGEADVVRITMNYGLHVDSTLNHPWSVDGMWVEAQDIKAGDVLDINPSVYSNNIASELKNVNSLSLRMRKDVFEIAQPELMTEDISWFLGYLWGGGAMSPSKYRIRFVDASMPNLEKAQRILKDTFCIDVKIRQLSDRKASTLEVASKLFWHWLIRNDVWKYFSNSLDVIPKCVRASSKNHILAFLAGLTDADGCVSKCKGRKRQITVATAYDDFATHVQQVAWSVGLGFGCSHNTLGENFQKRKSIYLLTLGACVDSESFAVYTRNSTKCASSPSSLPWHHDQVGKNVAIVGKVKNVKYLGSMDTYDIEVANAPWYYNGAVKSHNTISKVMSCTEGAHLAALLYYIRWVQYALDDPAVEEHTRRGYPMKDISGMYPGHCVIGFPTKQPIADMAGDAVVLASEATPAEQYQWLRLLEKHWLGGDGCNNQISYTMKYNPDILNYTKFSELILENQPSVRACSVMPSISDSAYIYVPEEAITKESYDEIVARIDRFEKEAVDGNRLDCEGGSCPVEFDIN